MPIKRLINMSTDILFKQPGADNMYCLLQCLCVKGDVLLVSFTLLIPFSTQHPSLPVTTVALSTKGPANVGGSLGSGKLVSFHRLKFIH